MPKRKGRRNPYADAYRRRGIEAGLCLRCRLRVKKPHVTGLACIRALAHDRTLLLKKLNRAELALPGDTALPRLYCPWCDIALEQKVWALNAGPHALKRIYRCPGCQERYVSVETLTVGSLLRITGKIPKKRVRDLNLPSDEMGDDAFARKEARVTRRIVGPGPAEVTGPGEEAGESDFEDGRLPSRGEE